MWQRKLTAWLALLSVIALVALGWFAWRYQSDKGVKPRVVRHDISCTKHIVKCKEVGRKFSTPITAVAGATIHWMGEVIAAAPASQLLPPDVPAASLVIDILGHASWVDRPQLFAWLSNLKAATFKGLPPQVWIRYKGNTKSLPEYADLLHNIRRVLGVDAKVVSTIDPDWINKTGFIGVEAEINEWLLLAEDLNAPAKGLVVADAVLQDMRRVSRAGYGLPFSVAIPTEGLVLFRDGGDRLIGTSDMPPEQDLKPEGGMRRVSMSPDPLQIEALIESVKDAKLRNFVGYVWEMGSDRPAHLTISENTINQLIDAKPLPTTFEQSYRFDRAKNMTEMWINNTSEYSVPLPKKLSWDERCQPITTAQGYFIPKPVADEPTVARLNRVVLSAPHEQKLVMTLSCVSTPPAQTIQLETERNKQ